MTQVFQHRRSALPPSFCAEQSVAWIASADVGKCSTTVPAGQAGLDQTCFHSHSLAAVRRLLDRLSDRFRDMLDWPRDRPPCRTGFLRRVLTARTPPSDPLTRWAISYLHSAYLHAAPRACGGRRFVSAGAGSPAQCLRSPTALQSAELL